MLRRIIEENGPFSFAVFANRSSNHFRAVVAVGNRFFLVDPFSEGLQPVSQREVDVFLQECLVESPNDSIRGQVALFWKEE